MKGINLRMQLLRQMRERFDLSRKRALDCLKEGDRSSIRIGLLTPYTGSNLGDGAIQEAVIANLGERYPNAKIDGFTTWPEVTERLHGISCYPLTAVYLPAYSNTLLQRKKFSSSNRKQDGNRDNILIKRIKSAWYFYWPAKTLHYIFKTLFRWLPMALGEFAFIVKWYRLIKFYDWLLVSGGGQIDDYWGGAMGHPYSLFRWALLSKATGTRFGFLSVGVCSLKSKVSIFFVKTALRLADYRSYRDRRSEEMVRRIGISSSGEVYPDLAFSYPSDRISINSKKQNAGGHEFFVGISPIAYLSRHEWPEKNVPKYERYIESLARLVVELNNAGHRILLFATDAPDRNAIIDIKAKISENCLNKNVVEFNSVDVRGLLERLVNVKYVIASRLHGVLLSHLVGKPTLAISYDAKVNVYMKDMGQELYCLEFLSLQFHSLIDKFRDLTCNEEKLRCQIRERVLMNKVLCEEQYEKVFQSGCSRLGVSEQAQRRGTK